MRLVQDPSLLGFSFNVTFSVGFLLVSLPAPNSTHGVRFVLSSFVVGGAGYLSVIPAIPLACT